MTFTWDDPSRLAAELAALPALDNATVEATDDDFVVDAVRPGAPLVISFSYVVWTQRPPLYFFGRSKKLEQLTGQPLNLAMLRDKTFHWFMHGVPGLGTGVDQVVDRLKKLIAAIRPSQVWCVGDSMGGHAAILFGLLLRADRIVSISPLSTFDPDFARRYNDSRFLWVMDAVAATLPENPYLDLPRLAREVDYQGRLDLIIGTSAGEKAPEAVNIDVMHAYRFGKLPKVRIHYVPESNHDDVALILKRAGKLDGVLLECLFDRPPPKGAPPKFEAFLPRVTAPGAEASAAVPASSPGNAELASMLSTLPPLTANNVAAGEEAGQVILFDEMTPRAPLLLCFGDAAPDQPVGFDFFSVSQQLQAQFGRPLSCILLRDPQRQWWLRGAEGLGGDCQEVAQALRHLIDAMEPERVVCAGNGMGGYAAIMFAMLLRAQCAVAVNPQSLVEESFARLCHDPRHLTPLAALDAAPRATGPRNLLQLASETRYAGRVEVLFGTRPPAESWDAGNHNAVHAARLGLLPNCRLHPCAQNTDRELLPMLDRRNVLASFLLRVAFVA
jgi:acetyl esterase/lipase